MKIAMETKLIVMFFLISIAIFIGGLYMHEYAHKVVFESYGIDATIRMWNPPGSGNFGQAVTFANVTSEHPCGDSCILSNNIVEAVGYQIQAIELLIFAGFVFLFLFMQLNNVKNKYEPVLVSEVQDEQA